MIRLLRYISIFLAFAASASTALAAQSSNATSAQGSSSSAASGSARVAAQSGVAAQRYAANSVLAEGKWARVKIEASGMHLITDAALKQLGFTDPAKVRVYGLGGRPLTEALGDGLPDDLPLVPSVRTKKGIVFFAFDQNRWSRSGDADAPYIHKVHPYSDDNYYFLSDRDPVGEVATAPTSPKLSSTSLTEFTDRMVYEKELDHISESGTLVLGEDFRTNKSQKFGFSLPDNVDGNAEMRIQFGAKTTSGYSTITVSANGTPFARTPQDSIIDCKNATDFIRLCQTRKRAEGVGDKLEVGIEYNYVGALFHANLDYIEVFYRRHLRLRDGELHFFDTYGTGSGVTISGCSENTVIWDVTDAIAPQLVEYTLSGDKASFTINVPGYREFIAFEPEQVTRSAKSAGKVANQNLHALSTPDMLIVTLPEYRKGAEMLAELHRTHDAMSVHILEPDEIYNEFSGGKADVTAIRKLLKMWYDRGASPDGHEIKYCIMMGKPTYDFKITSVAVRNAGYTPMIIFQSEESLSETTSFCSDDYIGMLEDVSDTGWNMTNAKINVAVGRFPVTTAQEAIQVAEKTVRYVTSPDYGPWRSKVMIIADDDDYGDHLKQAQRVYEGYRAKDFGKRLVYDRVYLDSYKRVISGVGPTYPQATDRMISNYTNGVMLTNYIGHASAKGWGHEHLWEWEDILAQKNNNLFYLYAATCGFAYWDLPAFSGAEHLMINPNGGVVGMIAATRTVYIYSNGILNEEMSKQFFIKGDDGLPRRIGDIYVSARNRYNNSNNLRYSIMGDPAIRIQNAAHEVKFNTINGVATDSRELPEIPALGSMMVEGEVLNPDGSLATGFNGTLNLQLYDAESVITTYGQGENGVQISYNDRKNRLTQTNCEVKAGKWSALLRVPPEINGNYSPAMIAGYAWSEKGVEANGRTERLYIYGYNEAAENDTIGPNIEKLYVNSENFKPQDVVTTNSIVFARVSDPSGINISDNSIGHAMTLAIDGDDIRSDLGNYFTIDATDPDSGTLMYPLTGVASGMHTLTFSVWDNAGNVSKGSLEINVGAAVDPMIYDMYTTIDRGAESVIFNITLDRPNTAVSCSIGVYDLLGRKVWETTDTSGTDVNSKLSTRWDLCDSAGVRVPRGIYIYRATIETPEGTYSRKSKKLAVPAPVR